MPRSTGSTTIRGSSRAWSPTSPRAASSPSRCRGTTARRLTPRWSPPPWRDPGGSDSARRSARGRSAEPAVYHDLLQPHVSQLDIWETEYLHALDGDNPVVEWTRGSALKPLLDALDEPERSGFLAEYAARIARAYPRRPDGRTLLPFRRLFIVAVR